MKNLKWMLVMLAGVVAVLAGVAIWRGASAPNERLELVDVQGDRSALNDFVLEGVLTDYLHDVRFSIVEGQLQKSYAQYDKGILNPAIAEVYEESEITVDGKVISVNYGFAPVDGDETMQAISVTNDQGERESGAVARQARLLIEVTAAQPGGSEPPVMQVIPTELTTTAEPKTYFYFKKMSDDTYRYDYSYPMQLEELGIAGCNDKLGGILTTMGNSLVLPAEEGVILTAGGNALLGGDNALYGLNLRRADAQNPLGKVRVLSTFENKQNQPLYLTRLQDKILMLCSKSAGDNVLLSALLFDEKGALTSQLDTGLTGVFVGAECYEYASPQRENEINFAVAGGTSNYFLGLRLDDAGALTLDWSVRVEDAMQVTYTQALARSDERVLRIYTAPVAGAQKENNFYEYFGTFLQVMDLNGNVLYDAELQNDSMQDYQQTFSPTESGWLFSDLLGQNSFFRLFANWDVRGA